MSKYVWYSGATSETGKKIAEQLNLPCGTRHPRIGQNNIICWGATLPDNNSKYRIRRLVNTKYLNNVFQITANTDKRHILMKFYNAGIAPKVVRKHKIKDAIRNNDMHYPVIGRDRNHRGGVDAKLCLTMLDINRALSNGSDHFVQFIPAQNEYRIHVFDDSILRCSKKVRSQSDEVTQEYIRSRDNGWRMRHLNFHRVPRVAINAAKKAVKIVGLDFGAVDIIYGEDNNAYVLEVNTGPGLDDRGLELYVNKIQEYLNQR